MLERESEDGRAAEAVMLFYYQVKKWIGAFAAVLGELHTLVFASGTGENGLKVRAWIYDGLEFLGIELNERRNAKSAPLISPDVDGVAVRIIRIDEELIIARSHPPPQAWRI